MKFVGKCFAKDSYFDMYDFYFLQQFIEIMTLNKFNILLQ